MSEEHLISERIYPAELELADPHQRWIFDIHVHKYSFAAMGLRGRRVLDLACGAGYGSRILAEKGGAASVTGVDIDPGTIEYARRRYAGEKVSFECSDYKNLDAGRRFDAIVSINTLEYVAEPEHFLLAANNLLADGGEIVVNVHTTPTTDFNPFTLHDITRARFLRMLRRAGFEVVDEFLQIKHFEAGSALSHMQKKKSNSDASRPQRSLLSRYIKHPVKALRRLRSVVVDGLTVKTLTARARLCRRC